MSETVTWSPSYGGDWRDLPDTSTPILASDLENYDAGILAAVARANAAYNTAENAAGGDGNAIPGLVLDGVTDDGPAINAALNEVEDGTRGAHLTIHGNGGQVCYINTVIKIDASRVILDADIPIKFGPDAIIRPWGVIAEVPLATPDKPALTADADEGDTVVHVDFIPADWQVGDYLGLRGERTASGSVPNDQIYHGYVTALDRTGLTITFGNDPLTADFKAVNDTPFSNKESQLTKVLQSPLTGTPDAGDVTVTVGDTSFFVVGDIVQIIDDTHTLDDGGEVQDGNFAHKECALVAEIPNGTSIKLSHALHHTYDGPNARVQKLDAIRDVQLRNWRISFTETPADNQHAIEIRYAYNVHAIDMHLIGGGDNGTSWAAHAIRFTDSLACSAVRPVISNPSSVTAARGYGVTFYGATGCWVEGASITGCRHSVLWFNGAANCWAINCISTDARISDYDAHGADCVDGGTRDCVAVGGTRTTPDSNGRSAWKWGNPSHRPGDRRNTATGSLVLNYAGTAVEGIPDSGENLWQGVVRGATTGIKLGPLAVDDNELVPGFVVRDSVFYDVATPFAVDGGPGQVVRGLVVENTSWHRCGSFVLANAPGTRFVRNQVIDPVMGSSYALTATGCPGLQVKGNDFTGAPKGVDLTGCTNARVTGNTFHDLTGGTVVLHDGGGNTGFLFRGNDYHPGNATEAPGTASGSRTVVL